MDMVKIEQLGAPVNPHDSELENTQVVKDHSSKSLNPQ